MDDITNDPTFTTDYDTWVTDPGNLAQHIGGILANLTDHTVERAREASIRRRWPYLVNPDTGHLNGYELCWICASALVHRGKNLPHLRACRWCLAHDSRQAVRLGLKHLLPVFDWPAPPVIDPAIAHHLDAATREAVTTAWSSVSLLDRWRLDSVQLSYGYMDVAPGDVIDLDDWQDRLTIGSNRSRACWDAYVEGYHPALRRAVRRYGVPRAVHQ